MHLPGISQFENQEKERKGEEKEGGEKRENKLQNRIGFVKIIFFYFLQNMQGD